VLIVVFADLLPSLNRAMFFVCALIFDRPSDHVHYRIPKEGEETSVFKAKWTH
jgi:hypothetical protein